MGGSAINPAVPGINQDNPLIMAQYLPAFILLQGRLGRRLLLRGIGRSGQQRHQSR
ncbi:hypothetical protein D3C85_1821210 [compost metagenome]